MPVFAYIVMTDDCNRYRQVKSRTSDGNKVRTVCCSEADACLLTLETSMKIGNEVEKLAN